MAALNSIFVTTDENVQLQLLNQNVEQAVSGASTSSFISTQDPSVAGKLPSFGGLSGSRSLESAPFGTGSADFSTSTMDQVQQLVHSDGLELDSDFTSTFIQSSVTATYDSS